MFVVYAGLNIPGHQPRIHSFEKEWITEVKSSTKKKMAVSVFALIIACSFAILLAACSPHARSQDTVSDDSTEVFSVAWSIDSDCGMCHAAEQASMADSACPMGIHAQEGTECITCHVDSGEMKAAHDGATIDGAEKATRLRKTKIDEAVCLSCHNSQEELAEKTTASAVLTDSKGTNVNPHALPDGEGHADIDCTSCHSLHSDEMITETAPEYCEGCHHKNVYQCNTCHE